MEEREDLGPSACYSLKAPFVFSSGMVRDLKASFPKNHDFIQAYKCPKDTKSRASLDLH